MLDDQTSLETPTGREVALLSGYSRLLALTLFSSQWQELIDEFCIVEAGVSERARIVRR